MLKESVEASEKYYHIMTSNTNYFISPSIDHFNVLYSYNVLIYQLFFITNIKSYQFISWSGLGHNLGSKLWQDYAKSKEGAQGMGNI